MSNVFYEHDRHVTIFHYCKWNKQFIQKEDNYYQQKGLGLPANSTDIPIPNEELPLGYVYVFENNKWVTKKDDSDKVNTNNKSYICREKKYFEVDTFEFYKMPKYEEIEKFTNPVLQSLVIISKYLHVQYEYIDILDYYKEIIEDLKKNKQFPLQGYNPVVKYRLKTESLMLSMRGLFDELVQLTYVTCYKNIFISDNKIKIDCIGDLFNSKKSIKYPLCKQIIIGDGVNYEKDEDQFLETINTLFNSIKHSFIHYEAYSYFPDIPNVLSFYKERNNFSSNEVMCLNHSLSDIMLGFQSNFKRIIENQKKYSLSMK